MVLERPFLYVDLCNLISTLLGPMSTGQKEHISIARLGANLKHLCDGSRRCKEMLLAEVNGLSTILPQGLSSRSWGPGFAGVSRRYPKLVTLMGAFRQQ